jgi:hypothetical protein
LAASVTTAEADPLPGFTMATMKILRKSRIIEDSFWQPEKTFK